jgi:hypothetical protein
MIGPGPAEALAGCWTSSCPRPGSCLSAVALGPPERASPAERVGSRQTPGAWHSCPARPRHAADVRRRAGLPAHAPALRRTRDPDDAPAPHRAEAGPVRFPEVRNGSKRLPPRGPDLLAQHVAAHCPEGPWLFTGKAGKPPHQNTVGYRWRTTIAAADLSGVKPQDLRHFYASGLIASGCDVVTVQRALGHASATTTLNTYSHLWPTAEDRTGGRRAAVRGQLRTGCGLSVSNRPLTSTNRSGQTLKRNSTTSPSAMT